jgi:hypothetical protein
MEQLEAFITETATSNVFWLHGAGNNGKTTMINQLLSVLDNRDKYRIDLDWEFDDINFLPRVVVTSSESTDTRADTKLLELLREYYPQTRFIVESNFAPPTHLECQSLCLFQMYQNNMKQKS